MAIRSRLPALALGLVLTLAPACGGGGRDARPVPSAVGAPVGQPLVATVGPEGATLTSDDGRLSVVVPPGALAQPVEVTLTAIADTAPGGVGLAWRLGPEALALAAPATLTFAPGQPVAPLAVASQASSGFWLRRRDVARDAAAGTLTASTSHAGDWAVTTTSTARDLQGVLTLADATGLPATVTGALTLDYAGEDAAGAYYVLGGTLTAPATLASGAGTCAPAATTWTVAANVAELVPAPARLRWGTSGLWTLACSGAGGLHEEVLAVAFDTVGISHPACARTPLAAEVATVARAAGDLQLDCGGGATQRATWELVTCDAGAACQPAPCRTGTTTCATPLPTCVDAGAVADGTDCGGGLVCTAGVCGPP